MDVLLLVVTSSMAQRERPMGGMPLVQANIFAPQDLLLILLIALLFFGGKKLPEIGSSLGKAMREFRRTTEAWDQPTPSERPQAAQLGPAPQTPEAPAPSSAPAAEASRREPQAPAPGTRV
jgi:sec-independent protein translocase protein TatA